MSSHATVVHYTTRAGSTDENEKLIKAVFAQLAAQLPKGANLPGYSPDAG
jgi:hypothetical protein